MAGCGSSRFFRENRSLSSDRSSAAVFLWAAVMVVVAQVAHEVRVRYAIELAAVEALSADELQNHLRGGVALADCICSHEVYSIWRRAVIPIALNDRADLVGGKHDPER